MRSQDKLTIRIALAVLTLSAPARASRQAAPAALSIPENLVVDLRIFETRSANPDDNAFESMSIIINTDGREVDANQWLATVVGSVPGSFVAALAYDITPVERGVARFEWTHRSSSFHVDLDFSRYHPTDRFESESQVTWKRRGETLREFVKPIALRVGQTAVWSAPELEVNLRDYLSNFRGYRDSEHRGLLFEKLQTRRIHLILLATPRLLAEDEAAQLSPERLQRPTDKPMPKIDNPLGVPLIGTVVVGFEIDLSGIPLYPQIVWSSVPEVNPRVLGESIFWRFPPSAGAPVGRRWGRVEIEIDIP